MSNLSVGTPYTALARFISIFHMFNTRQTSNMNIYKYKSSKNLPQSRPSPWWRASSNFSALWIRPSRKRAHINQRHTVSPQLQHFNFNVVEMKRESDTQSTESDEKDKEVNKCQRNAQIWTASVEYTKCIII